MIAMKFDPGVVICGLNATEAISKAGQHVSDFLDRHCRADYGEVSQVTAAANPSRIRAGHGIICSEYRTLLGDLIYVTTFQYEVGPRKQNETLVHC